MLSAGCLVVLLMGLFAGASGIDAQRAAYTIREPATLPGTLDIRIPGTTVRFEMVVCPAGATSGDRGEPVAVPSMYVLTTEATWDLYDIFVYQLDEPDGSSDADAVSRPSKPYVPPDRGFGHEGYPAIGMTREAAEGFCAWLSLKLGLGVRLPTQSEWSYLATGGEPAPYCCGVDAGTLDQAAWFAGDSAHTTHPVGEKKSNAFGLFDMHGNAAEWVTTGSRTPIAMGGGYRDDADECTARSFQEQTGDWNRSDPQIPKSKWWLADCSWVGFRFVIDADSIDPEALARLMEN